MISHLYSSWGNMGAISHLASQPNSTSKHNLEFDLDSYIAYGNGRSYGDVCFNANMGLIDTRSLDRFIEYDEDTQHVTCQAGVVLNDLLHILKKKQKFISVSPGTSQVTIGGMVANDVHGKNHHKVGSFGNHIHSLKLLRSNGDILNCSDQENDELFKATIGGLGLTGLILLVTFKVKPVQNNCIAVKSVKTHDINQMLDLFDETDDEYEYTVAWLDMYSKPQKGIFSCGNHAEGDSACDSGGGQKTIAFNAPNWLLSGVSNKLFNQLYYYKSNDRQLASYDEFFYPLDKVAYWNRLYGKRGFYQYQFVVPYDQFKDVYHEILNVIAKYKQPTYLAVLKKFGGIKSLGYMSFPREGYTLAMDFPNKGESTLKMFVAFDELVMNAAGAIYPAKDNRMSADVFRCSFPELDKFIQYKDDNFCSDFWRRVVTNG